MLAEAHKVKMEVLYAVLIKDVRRLQKTSKVEMMLACFVCEAFDNIGVTFIVKTESPTDLLAQVETLHHSCIACLVVAEGIP